MLSRDDKTNIRAMNGLGHEQDRGWQAETPTPIAPPTDNRKKAGGNPFSTGLTGRNNLHSRPHNMFSSRNAVSSFNSRKIAPGSSSSYGQDASSAPSKKRPLDEQIDGNHFTSRGALPQPSRSAPSRPRSPLGSDSDDPMALKPGVPIEPDARPIHVMTFDRSAPPPRYASFSENEDNEPIASTSTVHAPAAKFKPVAVKFTETDHLRKKIRPMPGTSLNIAAEKRRSPPPKDLRALNNKSVSKRAQMKPKSAPKETRDSTSKSGSNTGSRNTELWCLPVKRLYWGLKLFNPQDDDKCPAWIVHRGTAPVLQLFSKGAEKTDFNAKPLLVVKYGGIDRIESADEESCNYIGLLSNAAWKVTPNSHELSGSSYWFHPGEPNPHGTIRFELDKDGPNWKLGNNGTSHYFREIIKDIQTQGIPRDSLTSAAVTAAFETTRGWASGAEMERIHLEEPLSHRTRGQVMNSAAEENSISPPPISRSTQRASKTRAKARISIASGAPSRPRTPPANVNELLLVYPPTGVGAVNITIGDYNRLEPNEFFNDTLIEFGLKRAFMKLKDRNPALADEVHIFNSFFYKKLSSKLSSDGYQSVRKWTSKFNLFNKKFIVIPINENFHWYVAIIYEPKHMLPPGDLEEIRLSFETKHTPRRSSTRIKPSEISNHEGSLPEMPRDSTPIEEERAIDEVVFSTSQVNLDGGDVSSIADASTSSSIAPGTSSTENESEPMDIDLPHHKDHVHIEQKREPSVIDIDMEPEEGVVDVVTILDAEPVQSKPAAEMKTQIFILDSLSGGEHPQPRRILSKYLQQEAVDKKLMSQERSDDPTVQKWFKDHVSGHNVKVPLQPNYCDCGVYVVHYAETFMNKFKELVPVMIHGRTPAARRDQIWEKDVVATKREAMKKEIDELAAQWREANPSLSTGAQKPSSRSPPVSIAPPHAPIAEPNAPSEPQPHSPHMNLLSPLAPEPPAPLYQESEDDEASEAVEAILGRSMSEPPRETQGTQETPDVQEMQMQVDTSTASGTQLHPIEMGGDAGSGVNLTPLHVIMSGTISTTYSTPPLPQPAYPTYSMSQDYDELANDDDLQKHISMGRNTVLVPNTPSPPPTPSSSPPYSTSLEVEGPSTPRSAPESSRIEHESVLQYPSSPLTDVAGPSHMAKTFDEAETVPDSDDERSTSSGIEEVPGPPRATIPHFLEASKAFKASSFGDGISEIRAKVLSRPSAIESPANRLR